MGLLLKKRKNLKYLIIRVNMPITIAASLRDPIAIEQDSRSKISVRRLQRRQSMYSLSLTFSSRNAKPCRNKTELCSRLQPLREAFREGSFDPWLRRRLLVYKLVKYIANNNPSTPAPRKMRAGDSVSHFM